MPRPLAPCNGLALLIALRVGGLAYACNDTLSEAAITEIMGPRLSAALASSAETSRSSGLLRCSVAAPSSPAAHDRGPVADPLQHGRSQLGITAVEGGDHHKWQSLEKARTSIEYRPSNRAPPLRRVATAIRQARSSDTFALARREAIAHLAKIIPKTQCNLPEVLTASDIITKAAEQVGPVEFARIATLQAINRHVERAFDPSRKDTNQGRWRAIDDKKPPA